MNARKPYRSPFWRPEATDEPQVQPTRGPKATSLGEPERESRPSRHAQRRFEKPVDERSVDYAPEDLVLFGRLMDFGNRTADAEPARRSRQDEGHRSPGQFSNAQPSSGQPRSGRATPDGMDDRSGSPGSTRSLSTARDEHGARSLPNTTASNVYSARDAALFQGLQSSFSAVRDEATQARPSAPASEPPSVSNSYAQHDLDAFAKLSKFG